MDILLWDCAEWKKRYVKRLALAIGTKDALSCYYAMGDDIDYSIHPNTAADDELSYMGAANSIYN